MDLGFLLAFLVIFHLVSPLFGLNYSNSTCPENFACHNLLPFQFPSFSSSQPHSCGLCMASCDAHSPPKIKLNPWSNHLFDVVRVSESYVIKLHDPRFQDLLLGHGCESFIYDMQIPTMGSISYAILRNITLFKCSKSPDPGQETARYFHNYSKTETCGDFNIYYRVPKSDVPHIHADPIPFGCSTVHLPVRPADKVSNHSNLFDLLTADFDLRWHPPNECNELCQLSQSKSQEMRQSLCAKDEIVLIDNNSEAGRNELVMILLIAAPACGVPLLVILVFCFRRKLAFSSLLDLWKAKSEHHNVEAFLKKYGSQAPKRYHYSDVKKMTNSFKNKLGQGGYGSVYKGKLQDGSLVAVKILKESKGNGGEFINEIASISGTSHVNIVTLLGFCFQGDKRALVYEFMANGSLEKFIYGERALMNRQLDWSTLYKIAVGIARGLEYLHRGCNTRILHFDIKPHNILLDKDFCPKISDFGLAKLCPAKESILSVLTARGTIGYIAPEVVCRNIGGVSHKSDVYSYGMMVLEMVGGRKNVEAVVDHTSEIYFPHWIYTRLDRGEELGLSGIKDDEENRQARKMLIVSLWCIQTQPANRPTITKVLEMLEGPLETLQMPPKPFFSSPPRASSEGQSTTLT